VRYVTQSTFEEFNIRRIQTSAGLIPTPEDAQFFTSQPHSAMTDPGLYLEYGTPWTSYLRSAIGGRVDFVNTHARNFDPDVAFENDTLGAAYLTTDLEMSPEWTARGGIGYAQRVPDLVNRYSQGIFLAIMQSGFNKVLGDPDLRKESATQVDFSLIGDYGDARGRGTVFYTWVKDYHTYASQGLSTPPPPVGAEILQAFNTPLATLTGFELYGEYQTSDVTTYFASAQFVYGVDRGIRDINDNLTPKPLPQISPLQGRLGVRWTDPSPTDDYGLEWGFRLVARQNRAGFVHNKFDFFTDELVPYELQTAGFYTSYLRGYWNLSESWRLTGGIDNLFDRTYLEHLDIRLRGGPQVPGAATAALAPGFTAYAALEWLL
jgi:iron complex outermembrane receptor protein